MDLTDQEVKVGLGKNFGAILRAKSSDAPATRLGLMNSGCVVSWSWKDVAKPTIYAPGCPAKTAEDEKLCKRTAPKNLVLRSPPFDAPLRALLIQQPDIDLRKISVVSNHHCMLKLLHFALGCRKSIWRIDVDVIGDTVFYSRWGWDITGSAKIGIVVGRSKNTVQFVGTLKAAADFPILRYLPKGLEQTTTYHRLTRYAIGELEYHMYQGLDAYIGDLPAAYFEQSFDEQRATAQAKVGRHDRRGFVEDVEVHNLVPLYKEWEDKYQDELKIFVDSIKILKEAVAG
ncbi:uncharacterized protein PAC_05350 [Phialocephala subalpina]|uniref:Uncharacterized protein n=1 Tax=Phialocephala subalpina TaxID=576137 RepID=A0A1L7WRQ3_9HELO|nr:uncharacterized protein PAC_05350 [Phialocephala subalpina]